jgi:hypothetical protein
MTYLKKEGVLPANAFKLQHWFPRVSSMPAYPTDFRLAKSLK